MKTLFLLSLVVSLTAGAKTFQTRTGDINKTPGGWVLTDERSGLQYQLVAFPPAKKEFQPPEDFYYLTLKGKDVACRGARPCFQVSGYDLVMYDPVEKDSRVRAVVRALPKNRIPTEMGGKTPRR